MLCLLQTAWYSSSTIKTMLYGLPPGWMGWIVIRSWGASGHRNSSSPLGCPYGRFWGAAPAIAARLLVLARVVTLAGACRLHAAQHLKVLLAQQGRWGTGVRPDLARPQP